MFGGLPVVLLAWLFMFLLVATSTNPNGRWALRSGEQFHETPAGPPSKQDGFIVRSAKLLAWSMLFVLGMALVIIAVDTLFGHK